MWRKNYFTGSLECVYACLSTTARRAEVRACIPCSVHDPFGEMCRSNYMYKKFLNTNTPCARLIKQQGHVQYAATAHSTLAHTREQRQSWRQVEKVAWPTSRLRFSIGSLKRGCTVDHATVDLREGRELFEAFIVVSCQNHCNQALMKSMTEGENDGRKRKWEEPPHFFVQRREAVNPRRCSWQSK